MTISTKTNPANTGEFSVVQFFEDKDDSPYEYVRCRVSAEEAFEAFRQYCTSVGARLGTTRAVIITDGGDCTNMHWKWAEGIIFPEMLRGTYQHGVAPPTRT